MFSFSRQSRTYSRLCNSVPLVVGEDAQQLRIQRFHGPNERQFEELLRFGPLYSADEAPILKNYKDAAWEHILNETEGDKLEITENYLSAIGDVKREAVDCYADLTMVESESKFLWIMLKDGCFLIQLAILILGGSSLLKYPKDHEIFGRRKRTDMKRWINSMFYFGNQIPFVVLSKIMEQPFYQKVLQEPEWEEPVGLYQRVLYELLFIPFIRKRNSSSRSFQGPFSGRYSRTSMGRSSNLLHGFHSFVLGTRKHAVDYYNGDNIDLESGNSEYVEDEKEFLSATQLNQAGISFKMVEGMGCRGIDFKSGCLCSVLFMPTLTVDSNTELMFKNLMSYEKAHQPNKEKQEVCAYVKFMSDLVQTKEDIRILATKGIIMADPIHKMKLPAILNRLAHRQSSQSLLHLRLQINEYSQPAWKKYKAIITLAFLITVVQTVFAVLSYAHDLKS